MGDDELWQLDGRLLDALQDLGLDVERVTAGAYVVHLPGERRPVTVVWLLAGEQDVAVEAFVMHVVPDACPDPGALHRLLLARNLRLRDVHFALDDVGDVFLTGSLPHSALAADRATATLDRLLGEVSHLLESGQEALERTAYGNRLALDPALAAKVRADGAGRRPAGTPVEAPHRDVRR